MLGSDCTAVKAGGKDVRQHQYNVNYRFVISPEEYNKYSDREFLRFCLGATIYAPGTKALLDKIVYNKIPGLTSMVFCFEDACPESKVEFAEQNVLTMLDGLADAIDSGKMASADLPLLFCRVRNQAQFEKFSDKLTKRRAQILTGINFPKFDVHNGANYLEGLLNLNKRLDERLYAMPIIESARVAYKETRIEELVSIKKILDAYHDMILQIRVGATDFSSFFGVRRGIDYSIYDIMPVRDILGDIVNILGRNNEYILSGPVWEYFQSGTEMVTTPLPQRRIEESLLRRDPIVNLEIDGLLREVIMDKANGFVGRTVIHPSHIKYVNALLSVTREEYEDALAISNSSEGGVFKGNNKMNEVTPHSSWAYKTLMRARAFGVIESAKSYWELLELNGFSQ